MIKSNLHREKYPELGISIFPFMSALAMENKAINLAQGFPGFDVSTELLDLVTLYMKQGCNQYSPMQGVMALREIISEKQKFLYDASFNPDTEITITSGATEAVFVAVSTLVGEGDEVICFEPVFDIYIPAVRLNKGVPVLIELTYPDFKYDWQKVKESITPRTKVIILNSPHNPTGKTLKEDDIKALWEIVKDTSIHIISDEVYEHMVFDNKKHISLSSYPELKERSIIVASLGKVLHCTGWRIGYSLAPEKLTGSFRKIHQFVTFSANTPVQYAMADYLKNRETYLNLPAFFQQKRDLLADRLRKTGFRLSPAEGSYFQIASYADISTKPDMEFAKELTRINKVAAIPVSAFYRDCKDYKILRFCFAKKDEELDEACHRLSKLAL